MIRTIYKKHHEQGNFYVVAVGLSTDEKPTQKLVTGSTFYEIDTGAVYRYDEAGGGWLEADSAGLDVAGRVSALEGSSLASGAVVESVGIPAYVSDVTQYSAYGIADPGWYSFARITSPDGTLVSAETTVTGAAGFIATPGAAFVDVAVKFGVTAMSQAVTINWGAATETYVFKATDLAIRNLDYRTTFYLYDLAPFVTWTYALTTDAKFAANKNYYTKDGDTYTLATVTAGEAVPEDTYYNHSKVRFEGMTRNVTYELDDIIDCPIDIVLPEVEKNGYGAWFEFQLRYNGSYSCRLVMPDDVKAGQTTTQAQKAGFNTIELMYRADKKDKVWTLLNTNAAIPD